MKVDNNKNYPLQQTSDASAACAGSCCFTSLAAMIAAILQCERNDRTTEMNKSNG